MRASVTPNLMGWNTGEGQGQVPLTRQNQQAAPTGKVTQMSAEGTPGTALV